MTRFLLSLPRRILFVCGFLLALLNGNLAHAQVPVAGIRAGGKLYQKGDTIKACAPVGFTFANGSIGNVTAYSWIFPDGSLPASSAVNPGNVNFTTPGIKKVVLAVSNNSGKDTALLYLNLSATKPTPGFSFAPNNQCGNLPVQFTNTSTGAETYLWRFTDGRTSEEEDPSFAFNTTIGPGTKDVNVKLIATNEFGCKDSVTRTVRVVGVPDASVASTDLDVQLVDFNGLQTFKKCANEQNFVFNFFNTSVTKATNTKYTIDWGDGSPRFEGASLANFSHPYTLGNHVMTITVNGAGGCIGEVKYNVFLGTNPAGGIGSPGNTTICGPQTLSFPLSGTTNNPPGTQYAVSINDGSALQLFTHPAPSQIDHLFDIGSCGISSSNGSTTFSNSFKVTLDITNPCGVSSSTVTPIYVSSKPRPRIEFYPDSVVCENTTTTIYDNSISGNNITVSGASSSCSSTGGTAWKITPTTGWSLQSGTLGSLNGSTGNYKLWTNGSSSLGVRFETPGNYTVTIYKGNECGADSTKRVVCVREKPKAEFTIQNNRGCAPFASSANNISPTPDCGSDYFYWTVTRLDPEGCASGSGSGYAYINGTGSTSANPSWNFTRAGKYVIKLTSYANGNSYSSCGIAEKTDTIFVAEKPKVSINAVSTICAGEFLSPLPVISSCYSSLSGNPVWTFTGGDPASFTGATPGNIRYNAEGNYTIQLAAENSCGITTSTKTVQVVGLPVANPGQDITICSGEATTLGAAPVSGYTYSWNNTANLSSSTIANPVFTAVNNTGTDQVITLKLTVRLGVGCESEAEVRVTVRSAPVITATPSSASICLGDSVEITASGADTYTWSPAAFKEEAGSFWLKPATTTSYLLTGKDVYGCARQISIPITVKPLPPTEAGPDFISCDRNEDLVLGGSPANGIWEGTGVSNSGAGYRFNPSVPGIGVHKLYYTATLNGCSLKDSVLAEVVSLQTADAGNDVTVCAAGPVVQLQGNPVGGTWSGSPLVSSDGRFTPSAPGTYTLLYTFGAGSCRVSDKKTITVLPGIANNSIPGKQDICLNETPSILTGTNPSGGDGAYTYQWQTSVDNVSWNDISGATDRDYQPGATAVTTYYRRIVQTSLCSGAQGNISITAAIVVHEDAQARFSAAPTTSCTPFVLDGSVVSVTEFPERNGTYKWYADNQLIGSGNSGAFPGFTINTENASVMLKLVTESQWGCRSDSMETAFKTVAGATASFTKSAETGCTPLTVSFTNTSSRITGVQHEWDFGNGKTFSGANPDPVEFVGSPEGNDTTYYIRLSISNGCTTSVFLDSVLVKPLPKVLFGVDTTIGCSPLTLSILNGSRGGPGTYYWDFGNGDTALHRESRNFDYTYLSGIVDTFALKLRMENSCGEDSLALNIVVVPNQIKPQIAVQGNELYGCAPHLVQFVNTTIGASRYLWDFQDGSASMVTQESPEIVSHTFMNPGTYPVKIRLTNGCSDTTVIREVNVAQGPEAAFSFLPKPYCENTDVTFTNQSGNAESYIWRFGDGSSSTQQDVVHAYAQPGTYTVELISFNSNPFGTRCSDTSRQQVTIVERPVAALNTNLSTIHCAPFTLVASVNPAGLLNANWYFDDPLQTDIGVGFLTNHTYAEAGEYRLKVIVLNEAGCADSAFANFTVRPTPEAGFETSDIMTCSTDTTVTFTNTTTYSGTDGIRWEWLIDDVVVGTSRNLTHRFRLPSDQLLPKTYSVQLVSFNSYGCSDTSTGYLRMNPTPIAAFSIGNNNGCVPYALQINNRSKFSDSYQWFLNGELVSTEAQPSNILLTESSASYTLRLVAGNIYGCRPDEESFVISTAPKPAAAFDVPDSLSCNGILDIRMENKTTGATSYIWDFGDQSPREYSANPRHVYAQNGEYDLLLITDNGVCKDTASKIIRVGLRPAAAFESDVTTGCGEVTVNFKNLSNGGIGYVWDFGNGNYSGQKDPTHVFNFGSSPYTVKLVASGLYGCADTLSRVGFIQIKTPPTAAFRVLPSNITEIPNYTFRFVNESNGEQSPEYTWSFGDGNGSRMADPQHTYQDTGTFRVSMIVLNTEEGCADTAYQTVSILGIPGWLQVPNAFQPGSARSELRSFLPKGTGLRTYKLQIFNAWGELLFETTKLDEKGRPTEGWDGTHKGKEVPQDAFVWKIQGEFLNGTEWKGMAYPGRTYKKIGTITIIR